MSESREAGRGDDGPAIVGVDVGSSSIKAVAFDARGRKLAAASRRTPMIPMATGGEYHPDEIFDAALAVLAEIGRDLGGRPVAGIAATGIGESCVLVDDAGRAVSSSIAWFDRRTVPEAAEIAARIGIERLFALTGVGPEFSFTLAKLLWMRKHWGEALGRARRVLMMADWIAFRLSGIAASDPTLAARTQYYDIARHEWSAELLALAGFEPRFPAPLRKGGTALGPVKPEVLAEAGLAGKPVVGVGGHDHIVAAMACGLHRPGTLVDSMGTAEPLLLGTAGPLHDLDAIRRGYLQGPIEPGRLFWVGGSLFTSGGAIEWVRALTGGADQATLIAEAADVPPGSGGVVFVPHVGNGVSPPNADPDARGAFLGLTTGTGRGELYRAVLEGLAMQARLILDGMTGLPGVAPPTGPPCLTGGGSRNRLLVEIKANVYGRPVTVVDEPESTALGAALLGGVAAGLYPDIESAVAGLERRDAVVKPDPALAARYDALRETVFARTPAALRPLDAALAGWRTG
ncbi:MAG TPA: FGGY family carbohydrate kinase [Bauldia sp.]|nr:FGGY family carbohydrate kinase [Bauldia sp.]